MYEDDEIHAALEKRTAELIEIRKEMVEKFQRLAESDPALLPRKGGGVGHDTYPYCVYIDFPESKSRIAFFEDARIDSNSCNFHPGRIGYVTFFKNLNVKGSINEKTSGNYLYGAKNRKITNLRITRENIDEVIEQYLKFMGK